MTNINKIAELYVLNQLGYLYVFSYLFCNPEKKTNSVFFAYNAQIIIVLFHGTGKYIRWYWYIRW